MNGLALFAELDDAICRAHPPAARAWREAQGWPRSAALQGIGGGLARIAFTGDGLYEPLDREGTGTPAIIIPCWPGPAPGRPGDLVGCHRWLRNGLLPYWSLWRASKRMRPLVVDAGRREGLP